jgi:hypothetical protein
MADTPEGDRGCIFMLVRSPLPIQSVRAGLPCSPKVATIAARINTITGLYRPSEWLTTAGDDPRYPVAP